MNNTVIIYTIAGSVFQEIQYNDFDELRDKLTSMIINNDSDLLIQLLINNEFLNHFHIINFAILLKLDKYNYISIILSDKKNLYCLGNENGKYMLNYKYDNYSKLLNVIIKFYENNSYAIIINSSYKELIFKAVNQYGLALEYASINLQNDKEIVLEAIKQNGLALKYTSINLQNNKEIVLEAVKQNGFTLRYASIDLQNNKEIVFKAVNQTGWSLQYASNDLKNNKDIVLEAVKQNGWSLIYSSIDLKYDEDIILEAIEQKNNALYFK